jgi:hypothetical protein
MNDMTGASCYGTRRLALVYRIYVDLALWIFDTGKIWIKMSNLKYGT